MSRFLAAPVLLSFFFCACIDFDDLSNSYCSRHPLASGCPGDGGGSGAPWDAGSDAGHYDAGSDGGADAGAGNLEIYVRGDFTPKTFSDGYAGQTPQMQVLGVGRLELLRSPVDSEPVMVVDHGAQPALVDLFSRSLAVRADSAAIPAGTYTHGRILLTQVRFSVSATAHQGPAQLPGLLTVVGALSDSLVDGQSWTAGRAEYRFDGGMVAFSATAALPPLPQAAGANVVSEPGKTWLVFPFSAPLVVTQADAGAWSATIVCRLYQSFRWQDLALGGYTPDVFDLDGATMSAEPVKGFGATDYHAEIP